MCSITNNPDSGGGHVCHEPHQAAALMGVTEQLWIPGFVVVRAAIIIKGDIHTVHSQANGGKTPQ